MQLENKSKIFCHTINLPALAVDNYDDEMRQTLVQAYKDFLEKHGYYKERKIAKGVYGDIITAHSIKHNQTVAIKTMNKLETRNVDELYREIAILKVLNHPNIIRFYQSFDTMFQLYIVMEYVQNGTLSDVISKRKHLDERVAQCIYRRLIDALEYCHNQGIVHLDIKSNNLLLDETFSLKLCDFGYARTNMYDRKMFAASSDGMASGYSCMEILRGKSFQPHYTDIWASGVVLFEMVYGKLPFSGGDNIELVRQQQAGIQYPVEPVVSHMCKELISKVLSEYRLRIGILDIKQLQWMTAIIAEKIRA